MRNEIITREDYAEIKLYDKMGNEKARALIDLEDIDLVKEYRWSLSTLNYVKHNKENLYLHRLIMNCPKSMEVDHINNNPLDNRKTNLRICTHKENLKNMSLSKRNTSGYKGVSWYKRYNKWKVRIVYNGKDIHLGYYDTLDEAIQIRKQAEIKYFGDYRNKKIGGSLNDF